MDNDVKKPLVSIIMPVYNSELFIKKSIRSVLLQTYKNWELIIIDDGSTDNSIEIIRDFEQKENRIKLITQKNSKQAIARNNGIKNSNGQIIAFLDSDDLWFPQKLEICISQFEKDIDLIFTDSYMFENDNESIDVANLKKFGVGDCYFEGHKSLKLFLKQNQIPILTVLLKKRILESVKGFDWDCVPAEDYDLWIRLLKNGFKFKSIKDSLSLYRINSLSSTNNDRYATKAVLKLFIKNFKKSDIVFLKCEYELKIWVFRWIQNVLNNKNIYELTIILKHFGLHNLLIHLVIKLRFIYGLDCMKKMLVIILNRIVIR
jgi:teichuronic acid biosynthesis glycosyltransferase TuaG